MLKEGLKVAKAKHDCPIAPSPSRRARNDKFRPVEVAVDNGKRPKEKDAVLLGHTRPSKPLMQYSFAVHCT